MFKLFFYFLFVLPIKLAAQQKMTEYKLVSVLKNRKDTLFYKSCQVNDSTLLVENYQKWDTREFTLTKTDTFIVYKDAWKKIQNNVTKPFLNKKDFLLKKKTIIESYDNEIATTNRLEYIPLKEIDKYKIYVYTLRKYFNGLLSPTYSLIYFSFDTGVVGFTNFNMAVIREDLRSKIKIKRTPVKPVMRY